MRTSCVTNWDAVERLDLTQILKVRTLSIKIDYVLILDWLPDGEEKRGDKRTSEVLAEWLQEKFGSHKVEYRRCRSLGDLESALVQATKDVDRRGVPVVHIEAHGKEPAGGESSAGFLGPDGAGGEETCTWGHLGDLLRPLNVATRFNLMLVAAACFGEGPVLAIRLDQPMPFTALVGYAGTVTPMSLKHSMLELYRGLFVDREELTFAVERADDQRHFPEDAVLRPTAPTVLALQAALGGLGTRIGADVREEAALNAAERIVRANGYDLSRLPYTTVKVKGPEIARRGLEQIWSQLWMTEEIPANKQRFDIDFDRAIEAASRLTSGPE